MGGEGERRGAARRGAEPAEPTARRWRGTRAARGVSTRGPQLRCRARGGVWGLGFRALQCRARAGAVQATGGRGCLGGEEGEGGTAARGRERGRGRGCAGKTNRKNTMATMEKKLTREQDPRRSQGEIRRLGTNRWPDR
jgi:hypothetical protein